ncbi:fimbria/pilus outer membrane usher protein [Burkholderia ubonensis]|uniref:fimbria/pilus outer membrane usher protein n=1 Tax=Burkholderia ubonensis TaxID=101571 RepID=UPI000B18DA2D|nr:fimbria/pilus outer membrane usher protein [Burkholderia ubonensis]
MEFNQSARPRAARARVCLPALKPLPAAVLLAGMTMAQYASATSDGASASAPRPQPGMTLASASFDENFLRSGSGEIVDLSRFANGNPLLAGEYRADVYVADRFIGRETITVKPGEGAHGAARICVSRTLFDRLAIDAAQVPADTLARLADPAGCVAIEELSGDAHASLDTAELRLDVSLPQALMRRHARGYVDPALWDSGVTAGMLGYNATFYRSESGNLTQQSAYVGLNAGFNVGGWMFRHSGSYQWREREPSRYNSIRTYVQRDITPLKARVTLGESNTSGDLFDTFAFRGVQLATDDQMWPESMRGYAPVVRGIAQTNARVTVRQGDAVLYETSVAPGEFVIDDLYPTGYGGDLNVTVTEADGRVQEFKVPYASVAQLLRPGRTRYSVVAGAVRYSGLSYLPKVIQATVQRGLTNSFTAYAGAQIMNDYGAVLAGGAFSTPLGAVALDVTKSWVSSAGFRRNGTSVRATYSKLITATNSNLSVAAYRFSSSGYMDLQNALQYSDQARRGTLDNTSWTTSRPRNRLSVTASQGFGSRGGNLYVSGYSQNFWDRSGSDTQFQVGYSNNFRSLGYTASISRSRTSLGRMENLYMLSLSVPLGGKSHAPTLNTAVTNGPDGTSVRSTVNGTALKDNSLDYSVGVTRNANRDVGANGSVLYRSHYSALQGSFDVADRYRAMSAGASGMLVADGGGVTASPYNAQSVAIVEAPAAAGARVLGYSAIVLDRNGHAVVPYLNPYRLNEVSIDPNGLPDDVELLTTRQQVAPRNGAIVKVRYGTVVGRPVLIRGTLPGGDVLPFGASVVDMNGNAVGTVGQNGRLYARLADGVDKVVVKWGERDRNGCQLVLPEPAPDAAADGKTGPLKHLQRFDAVCQPFATETDQAASVRARMATQHSG